MSGEEDGTLIQIMDGEVVIFDADEFAKVTGAVAVQVRDGALFVLKPSMKLANVESLKSGKVEAVK